MTAIYPDVHFGISRRGGGDTCVSTHSVSGDAEIQRYQRSLDRAIRRADIALDPKLTPAKRRAKLTAAVIREISR